jgi:uncharacterized protein YndB with AHSA1/START domain
MSQQARDVTEPTDPTARTAGSEIEIDAPAERVWQALTEARELERWFPLEAEVEPGTGGRIRMSWGNEFDGWNTIEAWDPPHHLRISWDAGQATDFYIEGRGGRTHLRVVTSGFPADASWSDMVEGTRLGWVFELRQLKHYLERHAGEDRRTVFLRRRVSLAREAAWQRLAGPDGVVGTVEGEVFDLTELWQVAALTRDPPDGLLRFSVDPSHDEPDAREISLWVCAWGDAMGQVEDAARRHGEQLARLFPEGRALEAKA